MSAHFPLLQPVSTQSGLPIIFYLLLYAFSSLTDGLFMTLCRSINKAIHKNHPHPGINTTTVSIKSIWKRSSGKKILFTKIRINIYAYISPDPISLLPLPNIKLIELIIKTMTVH